MNIYPEGCKLLIEPDPVEEKTKGGIIVPNMTQETARYRTVKGTIIAVGPSVDLLFKKDRKAKAGDRIFYALYGGYPVIQDKTDNLRIINDEDVVALIED